jgi:hypothetical protein
MVEESEVQHSTRIGDVEFVGEFHPAEREFLASQFSGCRFGVLARSARDEALVLLRWEPWPVASRGIGPRPLRGAPADATYVLDSRGPSERAPGAGPLQTGPRRLGAVPQLTRLDRQGDIDTLYPGHFPDAQIEPRLAERLRRWWYRALPVAMGVILAVWLALVVWSYATR